jgi:hypothetical protein
MQEGPRWRLRQTTRTEALEVPCPRCNVKAGEPCEGARGPREAAHLERHRRRATTMVVYVRKA